MTGIELVDLYSHRMSEMVSLKGQETSCDCISISADTLTAKINVTILENCSAIRNFTTYYPWYPPGDTDHLWLTSQDFHDTTKLLGVTVIKQTLRDQAQPIPTEAAHPQPVRNDCHSSPALRHDFHLARDPTTRNTEFISKLSQRYKPLYFTQMTTGQSSHSDSY